MGQVFADVGCDEILKRALNNNFPTSKDLTLKLFTNDYTPLDTSIASNFTVAEGGGYVDKTLTAGSWVITAANDPSDAVYAAQTWTFTGELSGSATIHGYYVVDGNNVLITAERLSESFQPLHNGDNLSVTPKIQASKGTPS